MATDTITYNETVYPLSHFDSRVKQLMAIYDVWQQDASDERFKLAKTEAAIREIQTEIKVLVEAQLKVGTEMKSNDQHIEP